MQLKMTPEIRAQAIELLARNERSCDVARHYHMSLVTLNKHIKRADVKAAKQTNASLLAQGLPLKPVPRITRAPDTRQKKGPASSLTPAQIKEATLLVAAGEHPEDIAAHYGCNERTIRKYAPADEVRQPPGKKVMRTLPAIKRKEGRKGSGPVSGFSLENRYLATALLLNGDKRDDVANRFGISGRYLTAVIPGSQLSEFRRDGLPEFAEYMGNTQPPSPALLRELAKIIPQKPKLSSTVRQSFNTLTLLAVPLRAALPAPRHSDAKPENAGMTPDELWHGYVGLNSRLHAHYRKAGTDDPSHDILWQRFGLQSWSAERMLAERRDFVDRNYIQQMGDAGHSLTREVMMVVRPGDKAVLGELWLESRTFNAQAGAVPILILDPQIKSGAKLQAQFSLLACRAAMQRNIRTLVAREQPHNLPSHRQVLLSPIEAFTRLKARSLLQREEEGHPLLHRSLVQPRHPACYTISLAPFA